jgi:hypothetical protein
MEPEGFDAEANRRAVRAVPGQLDLYNATHERLDISNPAACQWLFYSNALLIRNGVLSAEEIDRDERYTKACLIAGAANSGKTSVVRAIRRIIKRPNATERNLVNAFNDRMGLRRAIAHTGRPMRHVASVHLKESKGNPYYFRNPDVLRAWLRHDQERFRASVASGQRPALRRYCWWADFAHYPYAMTSDSLWHSTAPGYGMIYDGSLDQAEVLWTILLDSELIFIMSSWYRQLMVDKNNVAEPLLELLNAYRCNQSPEEQQTRLMAGALVTGYVQEGIVEHPSSDRYPVSYVYEMGPGYDYTRRLARKILKILYRGYKPDKGRQKMIGDVRRYLRENAQKIEQCAWSKEIEGLSLSQLPKWVASGLPAGHYAFGSPLTQPEPAVPPSPGM